MPVPIPETLESQDEGARAKADLARGSLARYLVSAAMAGAYVGVAVVLLLMVSASFIAAKSADTKLVQGAVFGVALTLVVFAGAELFTGNVMVMLQALWSKKVTPGEAALVLAASLLGNLAGSVAFGALVGASGVVNAGAPAGKQTIFMAALAGIIKTKVGLTGTQLFFRAVLCNLLVCLALWMAARTRSDAAKLICLFWALLAFVASGFEHSVANMTVFSLGVFVHADGATWSALSRNLLYTVPGNIVGGGVLVGAAYAYVGGTSAATGAEAVPVTTIDLPATLPAVVAAPSGPARRARTTTPPPRRATTTARARRAGATR
jgi:nitrite transporter NirC